MTRSLTAVAALLLAGCTVIDIRTSDDPPGVSSDALISGYGTVGLSANESVAKLELFGGRSNGSLLSLEVWKLLQVEVGLLGLSAGVGPLNAGIGVLFYEPVSPIHPDDWDELHDHDHD